MGDSIPITVKWDKETLSVAVHPSAGVKGLQFELEERTGVPRDRMKILAKSKGLWKGVLKESEDLAAIDWAGALSKAGSNGLQVLLMGSATTLVKPKTKTVFLEDLPPEEIAKVQEPAGLVNLGNTCYLNSVVQCLRVVNPLRDGLTKYSPNSSNGNSSGSAGGPNAGHSLFLASLKDTFYRLDRQANALDPAMLVQATRLSFPQFAQRGPQGQPMQQDAEEFYSGVLTILASEMRGQQNIEAGLGTIPTEKLLGAENLIDALFGMKMKETLTCDEMEAEPPVVSYDLHRKLVCNIQGGSDSNAQVNISDIRSGIELSLNGKIEKNSEILGRNAMWSRQQRLARLPPFLVVQFGRFFWKATPDSQDHAGVKCKVMKPVAFDTILDVYDMCSDEIKSVLRVSRDKALKAEEERINKKLKGEVIGDEDTKMDVDAKEGEQPDSAAAATAGAAGDEDDEALKAALAMSMEPELPHIGPGLPKDFQGQYELFAIVTHKGRDADGGHYMAWVKANQNSGEVKKIADTNQDNEDWFVFDDDEVSPCKTEDVLKLKGGGDWHMSYLNFYRAKK